MSLVEVSSRTVVESVSVAGVGKRQEVMVLRRRPRGCSSLES